MGLQTVSGHDWAPIMGERRRHKIGWMRDGAPSFGHHKPSIQPTAAALLNRFSQAAMFRRAVPILLGHLDNPAQD